MNQFPIQEPPYILDVALMIYFLVYFSLYETKEEWNLDMEDYFNVTIHAWLTFVILVSIAVRYPFTRQNAKEVAPEIAWGAPSFRQVCDQIAGIWATFQGISCLLCLVPLLKESRGMDGYSISFNYVVPLFFLFVTLMLTRFYPRLIRGWWYLPRMHQGTIQPDAKPPEGTGSYPAVGPGAAITDPNQPAPPTSYGGGALLGPTPAPASLTGGGAQPSGGSFAPGANHQSGSLGGASPRPAGASFAGGANNQAGSFTGSVAGSYRNQGPSVAGSGVGSFGPNVQLPSPQSRLGQ
eukprot:gene14599-20648_t